METIMMENQMETIGIIGSTSSDVKCKGSLDPTGPCRHIVQYILGNKRFPQNFTLLYMASLGLKGLSCDYRYVLHGSMGLTPL